MALDIVKTLIVFVIVLSVVFAVLQTAAHYTEQPNVIEVVK